MTCLKNIIGAAATFALITSASTGLINVPRELPFNYVGCMVTDRSNSQVPHFWSFGSDNMTIDTCTSYCSNKKYRYAGLEDSTQCFCSTEIAGTTIGDEYCDYPCAGNKAEMCGGLFITSLYQDRSLPTWGAPSPTSTPTV